MKDIQAAIKKAIELVKNVPDEYRNSSFEVILKHLIDSEEMKELKVRNVRKTTSDPSQKKVVENIINSNFDWTNTKVKKSSGIVQYLHILNVVQHEFRIDSLSVADIQKILIQKFRIQKTINTIGMSLMASVGKYVDRVKIDSGYNYRLTSEGRKKIGDNE